MNKKKEEIPLPEMGSVEDISMLDPQIITEGYNEAKALKRSIKEAADILDEKAMKFIGFLVTIIIALIAAFWALKDVWADNIFLYLVASEIVTCMVSMILLVFGVISGSSFILSGGRPQEYFNEDLINRYKDLKAGIYCNPDKQFMVEKISALSYDIKHNEGALKRIVKNYRRSIWLLGSASTVLGIAFLVCCLCKLA